ncbi:sugar nucleotide-binding protein [Spongiibacter marinus]|uniref:sugar nucleotide-binding protein n=1 Tax=Spongiibacter marinus TaxID=354246 RepID=UPI00195FAD26|nr:sugar nucleotide-binding protein [Spongiibacter marinus]MBM7422250.1 dTDP-4-dehydrorhamnose reductase [Spongiibacter marinus]
MKAAVGETVSVLLLCEDSALAAALQAQLNSRGRELMQLKPSELLAQPHLADGAILVNALLTPGEPVTDAVVDIQAELISAVGPKLRCYLGLSDARVVAALDREEPVAENATPAPQGRDAVRLAAMEEQLLSASLQALILRTGPLIATDGDNLLSAFIKALKAGQALGLDDSQQSAPTPVGDLARVLSAMIDQLSCGALCRGIYHYQSSGATSAYAFAEVAYAHAGQYLATPPDISIDGDGWGWVTDSRVLRCERLLRNFGIKQLAWRSWLPKMIKTLCEDDCDERL